MRACKQADTETVFQQIDLLDDRRRLDEQCFRCFIEAAAVCDNDECVELVVVHEIFLSKINQNFELSQLDRLPRCRS